MKCATFYFEDNKIEVFNSLLGKETLKVNGKVVSSKYSIFGGEHSFVLKNGEEERECKIKFGTGVYGMVLDISIEDQPIILSEKGGFHYIVLSGLFFGFLVYWFLNFVIWC